MKIKKIPFYRYFPIFSVFSLLLRKFIMDDYDPRVISRFREFLYFNILVSVAYFFIIGYIIPTFMSIQVRKSVKKVLVLSTLLFMVLFIAIHLYFLVTVRRLDMFTDTIDVLVGVVGGSLLGFSCSCDVKDN